MTRLLSSPIMAFVMIFALVLSGCGSIPAIQSIPDGSLAGTSDRNVQKSGNAHITLEMWDIWSADSDSNKKPFEKAVSDWNADNPDVIIHAEATENETYKTKIRTAVAVNEMPDIFYTWGAGFAEPFVDAGKVLPLDEYLNDGTKEKLVPGTLDYFTYDGKIYGLPIYMIAGVFYCNAELFNRYKVKIPDTFDELLAAVKVFKDNGITPMAVGEKDGWPGMFYQNILAIRTAGAKLCNEALNNQASFNRPEFVESAESLRELIKAGAFDKECMNMTRDEAESDFKDGKCAMYYNGSWVAGSLDEAGCPVKGKIVVKNFPVLQGSEGDPNGFLGGAIDTFMVSADTAYKDEAVRALKTIDEDFCKESYLSGASQPAWKVHVDESKLSPLAVDVSELTKSSTGFVLAWDTFLTASDAQTHINLIADIFAGACTPEEFAEKMQKLNEEK